LIESARVRLVPIHAGFTTAMFETFDTRITRYIPEAHGGVVVREFRAISRSGFELDLVEYRIPCP
jgi:hypothetical protein